MKSPDDIGPFIDGGDDNSVENFQVWIEDSMEKFSPESKYDPTDYDNEPDFGAIFSKDKQFGDSLFKEVISQIYSEQRSWFNDGPDIRASSVVGYVLTYYMYITNLGPYFTSIGVKLPPRFPESLRLIAYRLSFLLNTVGYLDSDLGMRKKAIQQTKILFSKPGKKEVPATKQQKDTINNAILACIKIEPKEN
uniref:Uncharacterized protein n=1 Tax=Pithovirus LCPAC401 TaxID=2506595 RepID=A0A481ZA52_9VIRU|nr:MAG: uncharacterized protein LCPAC401_03050 [Pithovirus LCPAC401]